MSMQSFNLRRTGPPRVWSDRPASRGKVRWVQGIIISVDEETGQGSVRIESQLLLLYLKNKRTFRIRESDNSVEFGSAIPERQPKPDDQIICEWKGQGAILTWGFLDECNKLVESMKGSASSQ